MAPPKIANPKKSAKAYRKNPEARARKAAYDTAYQSTPEARKSRAEHVAARRKAGIYGKGGPDMSRTRNGGFVKESASKNRARNRGRK